ncbi:MAG: C13 family peptidase [Gammaproteobacteria bacterium]
MENHPVSDEGKAVTGRPLIRSDWPTLILLVLALALWVIGDYQRTGPGAEPFLFGASGIAWYVLGLLMIAWVAAQTSLPRVSYRECLFLLAATAVPAVVLVWFASGADSEDMRNGLLGVMLLVGAGIVGWGLRRASGERQALAVWLSLMAAIGFIWATEAMYVQPSVWIAREADGGDGDQSAWRNAEGLLFQQPERIDQAISQMAPREPGRSNAFVVGFAGFGEQKVFAEEVGLALAVLGRKFGATERSVRLINDRRDLNAFPLATASGLRRALQEIGNRMDRASDVLFLVLSSHGGEGGLLGVQNGGLPLKPLRPVELAAAIHEAGIRWKVVIISACYSGAFVDALKDEYSIVLTASAADRTSFGCSDDRDLTYFGEAFFRDALPDAPTLREAFNLTSEAIRVREDAEGVQASHPQAFFGLESETHIDALRIRANSTTP